MPRDYNEVISDLPIYKAALHDDWDSVSELFERDPSLMTKQITYWWQGRRRYTSLLERTAPTISSRCLWNVLLRLAHAKDKLFEKCWGSGNNALHFAAKVGNTIDAKLLVEQKPEMTRVPNPCGNSPLKLAAWHGNKETLKYLLTVTPDLLNPEEEGVSPYTGVAGGDLITLTIMAGFYDVALDIMNMHPKIVLENDRNGQTALQILAQKPEINIFLAIFNKVNHDTAWYIFGSTITTAVKYGIHEIIEECILAYPGMVWYDEGGFSLFLAAIRQRQERVYNLVYQMSGHKVFASTELDSDEDENALHVAAKLAPSHRLNVVTGAALQMQRELHWFQEVHKFIEPSYKEALNKHAKTPRMVFSDAHKELLIEGQQWMKDTASSCTIVAALIVTMAFAAVFTYPGGNNDSGIPLFQTKRIFILFIVSDAFALFSSATSVLMFLGILTSRYAEDDFLYALPKRLTIGLISLFMSIAATMIAFSSALALVLQGLVTWIAAPLVIATSIPVCLFALLQFPLLVELVNTTYGRSIFHQQNHRTIH